MEKVNGDILFQIGIELDLPDLLNLCQSNKEINRKLCKQDAIWNYKLKKDFNEYLDFQTAYANFEPMFEKSKREYYILLYKLNKIKTVWNLKYNLYELYYSPELDLFDSEIKEIPKEIGQLHNLEILYLSFNQIENIPKEIGQLHNLRVLYLENNQIKNIPKEIGQLYNLQQLYLAGNKIKNIPKEIGQLHNLKSLDLHDNKIKSIPKEIGQLHNLKYLYLSDNLIKNKAKVGKWIEKQIPGITVYI